MWKKNISVLVSFSVILYVPTIYCVELVPDLVLSEKQNILLFPALRCCWTECQKHEQASRNDLAADTAEHCGVFPSALFQESGSGCRHPRGRDPEMVQTNGG